MTWVWAYGCFKGRNYLHYLVHSTCSTGTNAVLIMHGYFRRRPHTILKLGAAILTENIVYDNRHFFVRPATRRIFDYVPLFISQHDVTFELATPLPSTLLVRDICNKTYGNWLCVAPGCSRFTAILGEHLYSGLVDFVGWSSVLSFTEAHGGFLK